MAINVLDNVMGRFGILNASEIRLFSKSTDKLLVKIPQGNSLSLEFKSDSKTAKEQGVDAITWNLPKTGTLKLTTETISFAQLAEALGSNGLKLNSDNQEFDRYETFTVTTAGTITVGLKYVPLTNSVVSFNILTADGESRKEVVGVLDSTDVTKKTYIITDTDLAIGDIVEVNYVQAITNGGVYTFKVSGKGSDAAGRKLIANVLCKNRITGELQMAQLLIPNVVIENSLTLTFDAENPSKFEISMKIQSDAILKDENGDPLFFEFRIINPSPVVVVTPITDLSGSSSTATQATLTFTAPTGATSVDLQYKLSSDTTYSSVATSGSTGVRMSGALSATSTNATVLGLTSTSNYNFKLVVTGGTHTGTSNVATVTIA